MHPYRWKKLFGFPECKSVLMVSFGVSQRWVQTQPADSEMVAASSRPTTVHQAHSFSNTTLSPSETTPSTAPPPPPYPSSPTLTKTLFISWLAQISHTTRLIPPNMGMLAFWGGGASEYTEHMHHFHSRICRLNAHGRWRLLQGKFEYNTSSYECKHSCIWHQFIDIP